MEITMFKCITDQKLSDMKIIFNVWYEKYDTWIKQSLNSAKKFSLK